MTTYNVNNLNELSNSVRSGTYTVAGTTSTNGATSVRLCINGDDENQLISVWVTNVWRSDFVYDGKFRRRIRREYSWSPGITNWLQTSEVRYIYDGDVVIQERDVNNLPTISYTRGRDLSGSLQGAGGIGGLLARTDHSILNAQPSSPNAHAFYHADGSGNITALINGAQFVVAQYEYDPFGGILSQIGPLADANLYRFSSKEFHAISGLVYFGRRFYDPNLQRWLNRDPIGELGGLNLYSYVANNPMTFVDPFGTDVQTVIASYFQAYYGQPSIGANLLHLSGAAEAMQPPPFSIGLQAQANSEAGYLFGGAVNISFGFGLFYDPRSGISIGGFQSGGLFLGGPPASLNLPCSPTRKPSGVFGGNASWGVGPWISNAGTPSQLGGPFDQWNFNSPLSLSYATSDGTWIATAGIGYGGVGSFSVYPTTTWSAGGFNLETGQPNVYVPEP